MSIEEEIKTQIMADTIDECIKTLSKDEDTILTDKQYYTLQQLKNRIMEYENEQE